MYSVRSKSSERAVNETTMVTYLASFAACSLVYQSFHDLGLSTLLTLSSGVQCFAYACLLVKVHKQSSVGGISCRALSMQAMSYVLRLSSTTWLKGYIPVDGTGDWLYQLLDVACVLMALQLIYCVYKTHYATYQEESDSFDIKIAGVVCFVLAVLVHPDLNARPLFDTLWTTSLYIDVVAMLPQLWMMTKIGGEMDALNCHFVGATALSRVVNLLFWFHGFVELAPLDGSFNLAGWVIIFAHVVQVLLLLDFLVLYVKACMKSVSNLKMQLPVSVTHDV